jgi:Domain of unknown function (DUF4388)
MAFQGSLKELPLPDIIQLVSVSGKTGVFTLKNGGASGEIYLRDGHIVHARTGSLEGEEAVYELAVWTDGDFVFHPGRSAPASTIKRSNTNLLMEAARRIDEWQVLSKRIPSTLLVPVFTHQAKKTSVSLTPDEWELVSKIDERRSIDEIAIALGQSPFDVCKLLYGLVTSGLVALNETLVALNIERLQKMTPEEVAQLTDRIHQQARQLLTPHGDATALDAHYRLSRAELRAGRRLDAVVDLVRAEEKVVSQALGPNQSKAFLERVGKLLAAG